VNNSISFEKNPQEIITAVWNVISTLYRGRRGESISYAEAARLTHFELGGGRETSAFKMVRCLPIF